MLILSIYTLDVFGEPELDKSQTSQVGKYSGAFGLALDTKKEGPVSFMDRFAIQQENVSVMDYIFV